VVLEAKPKKIALLFFHHYEAVLALDAPLDAATDLEVYRGWESLRPYSEKTELIDLGSTREPNLEKLVEISPDLIIAAAGVHDAMLDDLRKVASTVVVSRADNFSTWQGTLREYGKILGEEALAEERITNLETLIADAREALNSHSDETVALIRPTEKEVTYWLPDYVFNPEGGLGMSSAFPKQDGVGAGAVTSYEGFADGDPDYIFLYEDALDENDETIWTTLEENALWKSLSAVKLGHVYTLDRSAFSGGPLAMELGVRTILSAMSPSEAGQVNQSDVSAWPRTYVDALGRDVVIEKQPERVISLMHVQFPDVILSLGVVPVGAASADTVVNVWKAFEEVTKNTNIVDIGSPMAPNLEQILELEPDIILAAAGVNDEQLTQLEGISTVVFLDQQSALTDHEPLVREIGKVLGKEAEGEQVLESVREKVEVGKAALAEFYASGETALFLMTAGNKELYIYDEKIVPFNKETGLGISLPENYPSTAGTITLEGLADLNPDHIFVLMNVGSEWGEGIPDEYRTNAVWNAISAAKNGHVYIHDASAFAQNAPIATLYGIDYVVNTLTKAN
jgi:iron complex transport system substrate-binding protein